MQWLRVYRTTVVTPACLHRLHVVCRAADVPHRDAPSLPGGENFTVDEYDTAPALCISALVTAFSYSWHQHSHPPQPLQFQISLNTTSNKGPYDEFHSARNLKSVS
jgi:hypothetical protein